MMSCPVVVVIGLGNIFTGTHASGSNRVSDAANVTHVKPRLRIVPEVGPQ